MLRQNVTYPLKQPKLCRKLAIWLPLGRDVGRVPGKTRRKNAVDTTASARRIAKNTLLLYFRMAVLLLVGLYTSRVVLDSLGESDYGIYNVVGGVVAMFTVISGALSSAVSRFITFELGRGGERLGAVFRCAVIVQLLLAAVVIAVGEPAGLWFIGEKMTVPAERIPAARIVLQFSLAAFVINLLSVPYNAAIVAHEKMGAFAAVGLFEGFAKLGVALLLAVSPVDRLVWYAMLMCLVAVCVRIAYAVYCRRSFPECRGIWRSRAGLGGDRAVLGEMFSFAGWNFIGVTAGVLKDQGGNILVNLFSATPAVNAGRGVAMQLSGAVQGFVTNFMTAVNPQITKSYAAGQLDAMHSLMRRSAKFSYFLILLFALPLLFSMEWVMGLWLKEVPEYAPVFARLLLVLVLSDSLSNPLITAQLATGDIRRYQLTVGGILLLNIPVSYLLLKLGFGVEWVVVVAIVLSQVSMFARLALLRGMVGLDVKRWLKEVWFTALAVTVYACVPPLLPGVAGLAPHPALTAALALCSAALASWLRGCTADERRRIAGAVLRKFRGDSGKADLAAFSRLPLKVYAATSRSEAVLRHSSSGGVFHALGSRFIAGGGTVCAALWDEGFGGVHHGFADTAEGLAPMCSSRYVQSSLGGCFLKIRDLLLAGKDVMFVGTPCQVRSLKKYVAAVQDNVAAGTQAGTLLTVEILCHGTPKPEAWRSFLAGELSRTGAERVSAVDFRDKSPDGWKDYRVRMEFTMSDGTVKSESRPYMQVPYMADFLSGRNLRKSCTGCTSRRGRSGADISIGDFWGVEKLMPEAYDPLGVSVVGIYSELGEEWFGRVSDLLSLTEVPEAVFGRSIRYNGGYGKNNLRI